MRLLPGVLSLAVAAAAVFGAPAARAEAAFSDALCPEASQFVIALSALTANDAPQKVYDAAHAVTTAYATCAKRQLTDGNVEPGVHYAHTRQAQFAIIEARALGSLNRTNDAKAVLEESRRLAQDVFDWRRSMGQNGGNRPGESGSKDTRPSYYHDSAKEILDAANAMLAKLNAPPAPSMTGAPATSPAPKPSPAP